MCTQAPTGTWQPHRKHGKPSFHFVPFSWSPVSHSLHPTQSLNEPSKYLHFTISPKQSLLLWIKSPWTASQHVWFGGCRSRPWRPAFGHQSAESVQGDHVRREGGSQRPCQPHWRFGNRNITTPDKLRIASRTNRAIWGYCRLSQRPHVTTMAESGRKQQTKGPAFRCVSKVRGESKRYTDRGTGLGEEIAPAGGNVGKYWSMSQALLSASTEVQWKEAMVHSC